MTDMLPTATGPNQTSRRESRETRRIEAISDEPLINFFHHRLAEIAFVAYAAVVAYMSFVPFDLTRPGGWGTGPGFWWGLRLAPANGLDILANLTLYAPLGLLACVALRRRRLPRWMAWPISVAGCLAMSIAIEYAQRYIHSRVASWIDVTANGLGAAMGASAVCILDRLIRLVFDRLRSEARRNWWFAASKAFVCLVLILHLRPYDVVVDVFHTAAHAVRTADVGPLAVWNDLPRRVHEDVRAGRRPHESELSRVQVEYILDRVTDTAVYAAAAAMLMLGMRHILGHPAVLFLWAGFVTCTVAATVTMVRILMISHGLDTAHFVCGLAGWPIGGAAGWLLLRSFSGTERHRSSTDPPSRSSSGHDRQRRSPNGWRRWRPIALACVAMVLLYELVPFDLHIPLPRGTYPEKVCLVPFYAHFQSRPNVAAYDLSGELLRYGVLAAALSVFLRARWQKGWRLQAAAVVALTGVVGVALEVTHLTMPSRQTDVTTVLLAMAGGFAGAVAVRWVSDLRRSLSTVVADDRLTGQLIEGPSYSGRDRLPGTIRKNVTSQGADSNDPSNPLAHARGSETAVGVTTPTRLRGETSPTDRGEGGPPG